VRARTRLARGPLVLGEPAPQFAPRLADVDPYRPDTIADGGEGFGMTVRAASVRGLAKRYTGGARQDDLCLRVHPPTATLLTAVADGVSAADRSALGAALAVRHAAAAALRQLADGAMELDWHAIFEQAAWALVEEHRRHSGDSRAGVEAAGSLATTLILAAVSPVEEGGAWVQLGWVGDSPALVLDGVGFELVTGRGECDEPLLADGVLALPRHVRAVESLTRRLEAGEILLVCTDGLALPLGDGAGEVGRALARELVRPPEIVDFARLLDFSRATYDDDRTLVAIWPPSGEAGPVRP
jgi:hypothetical protein